MSYKSIKKIAMFVSVSHNHYQKALITNISLALNAAGYYLFVFSFNGAYGEGHAYIDGERVLTQLPIYEDFDGIILCLDTFGDEPTADAIYNYVKNKAKCPVVSVRRECGTYNSVLVDDDNSMENIVRHLTEVHKFKDFFFVSGTKDHPDAEKRMACYKRVLAEYGVSVSEKDFLYGNFWNTRGKVNVDEILEKRNGKLPEVIVCANDYMAIAICNELSLRGIRIPEDVAVTGFDDISDAALAEPPLTSVRVSVESLAEKACEMLLNMINGKPVRRREYVKTSVVERVSCGCKHKDFDLSVESLHEMYIKAEQAKHENLQTVFMSIETENTTSIDELNRVIYRYIFNNTNVQDFFIVLNDFMDAPDDSDTLKAFDSTMRLREVIRNTKQVNNVDMEIASGEILPEEFIEERPCTYNVSLLHFLNRIYGYSVIRYAEGSSEAEFLQYFVTTISTAIEQIRSKHLMKKLIDRLSTMYVSDATTGLKNRHGFDEESRRMYSRILREGGSFAIITIDMDGLKTINDSFGHAEGDSSLRALAGVINDSCFSGESCFRVGGDEFQVLALDYSENSIRKFYKRFNEAMSEYNKYSKKPYIVQASYGHVICTPDSRKSLSEWMTISDNLMYEMKEKNRASRKILR